MTGPDAVAAADDAGTLRCEDVAVRRGSRTLLDRVTLALRPGRLTMLIGPNGAGKSTLLRVLAGTLRPDAGEARLDGRPLGSFGWRALAERRSVIAQSATVAFRFTAAEVVALGRASPAGDDVLAAMIETDCAHLAARIHADLSGGEQARVHLARALAQLGLPAGAATAARSRHLLLDEPVAALDPGQQHRMLGLLRGQVRRHGLAALVTLHDLNLASQYADEVVLLSDGRLVEQGTPAAVLGPAAVARSFGVGLVDAPLDGGRARALATTPEAAPR